MRQLGVGLCLVLLAGCPSFPDPVRPADQAGGPDANGLDTQGPLPDQLVPDSPVPPDGPIVFPDAPLIPDATQDLSLGAPCSANGHCKSGFCADFVCCDKACMGACEACDLPGSLGTCLPVPADQDPHNDCIADPLSTCGNSSVCDGKGACAKHAAGVICVPGSCNNVLLTGVKHCDGLGACKNVKDVNCFPYNCNNGSCYKDCTNSNEKTNCYGYYGCDDPKHTCYSSCSKDSHCNDDGKCDKTKCVKD